MDRIILIKYGELTTKKSNRNLFIKILSDNIKKSLSGYNFRIIKDRVRMFIECDEKDIDNIIEILKNIFGIYSIVLCYRVNTNTEDIKNSILEIIKDLDFKTFKVDTTRAYKEFSYNSQEFNNVIGGLVLKNKDNIKVDVHNPEYLLRIEIREDYTYIYSKEILGASGYPSGVAGKGILMLSGGIDSPVSGYLAMKRGINLECIYFESPPHTSIAAKNKVIALVKKLCKYQPNIKLHIVNFTEIQENIYQKIDPTYMVTIMRRMMYRITEKVLQKRKAYVIINGESVGQVASQTLTSMQVINNVTNYPVIRPVACFDKLEIINIAKKIDTYETSILPYEDCCTIFVPRHPVINPNLDKAIEYENSIDYETMIETCLNNLETIDITRDYKEFDI